MYLGTAERTPQIAIRPGWLPVFNDMSGPIIPLDMLFAGEEAFASTDLTRWNEASYTFCASRPEADGQDGVNSTQDIGTLMLTEGYAITLWVLFPYAQLPAYSSMPDGYRFPATLCYGPDDMSQMGTNPRKLHLFFHCIRAFDGSKFTLYDHDMSAVQGISTV